MEKNSIVGVLKAQLGMAPGSTGDRVVVGYRVWCPACGCPHTFNTNVEWYTRAHPGLSTWTFNDDVDKPTFSPSMGFNFRGVYTHLPRCHSFLQDGQWRYLNDCTHELAGQTVPVPPYPDPEPEWRP